MKYLAQTLVISFLPEGPEDTSGRGLVDGSQVSSGLRGRQEDERGGSLSRILTVTIVSPQVSGRC